MTDDITRRRFCGLVAKGTVAAGFAAHASPSGAQESGDVPWTSNDPHLSGNFLPVATEVDVDNLPVIAGRIPPDLRGAYMRNGPNPLFKPIAFMYPMDGDGMIHAVYFEDGKARYRNRFVETRGLAVERRVGHAVYGSFTHPVPVDAALIRPGEPPGPFKNGAFISVLQQGGHLLALCEATNCYEITMELDTIGLWQAGTDQPIRMGAHNRRHPRTGALYAIAYSPKDPAIQVHQIDPSGTLVKTFPVVLPAPMMMHDFVLTENHIVLFACPAVFDLAAAQKGQPFLQWKSSLGTRIGLVALDGSSTQWVDTDPFFVFHFANAFERGGHVIVDYVRHDSLSLSYGSTPQGVPTLHRMDIDISARRASDARIADMVTEFPRVNDALNALETRFVYLPTLTRTLKQADPPAATFNTMMKITPETGKVESHDFGNRIAGEPTFIPRTSQSGEDDGYLAIFVFDPESMKSDLVLMDAAHIDSDPVAVIRLPQRVPQGLHGAWIPKAGPQNR